MLKILQSLVLLTAITPLGAAENWPQFRGPGARGVADDADLPDRWSATDNVAWKTAIPGRGWSSPIVWGNRVFLTTVIGEDASNPPKGKVEGGKAFPEHRQPTVSERQWEVLCLDLLSGKVCLNEDGETFVVRAGERFELLGTNKLADDDMCFATPAMAGGRLLIRSSVRLYCIQTDRCQEQERKDQKP